MHLEADHRFRIIRTYLTFHLSMSFLNWKTANSYTSFSAQKAVKTPERWIVLRLTKVSPYLQIPLGITYLQITLQTIAHQIKN